MAIAFDAVTTSSASSYSLTVGSGSDRILWVGATVGSSQTITGVTYNGVAMTSAGTAATASTYKSYLFYLVAPASGSHTVAITTSGAGFLQSWAASYTGVDPASPTDGYATHVATTTNNSAASITTTVAHDWFIAHGFEDTFGDRTWNSPGSPNTVLRTSLQFVACYDSAGPLSLVGANGGQVGFTTGNASHVTIVLAAMSPIDSSSISVSCASMNYER